MSIKMSKMFFPDTKIANLNKSIDKKAILHAENNSCITQMSICKVIMINKGITFQCNLFVVLGNGPVLLGMPDCEHQIVTPHLLTCTEDG